MSVCDTTFQSKLELPIMEFFPEIRDFFIKKKRISLYKNFLFPFSISRFKTKFRDAQKDIKLQKAGGKTQSFYHLFFK